MPSTPMISWATMYAIRLRLVGSQAPPAPAYSFPAAFMASAVIPSPTTKRQASVYQVERRLRSLIHSARSGVGHAETPWYSTLSLVSSMKASSSEARCGVSSLSTTPW